MRPVNGMKMFTYRRVRLGGSRLLMDGIVCGWAGPCRPPCCLGSMAGILPAASCPQPRDAPAARGWRFGSLCGDGGGGMVAADPDLVLPGCFFCGVDGMGSPEVGVARKDRS